MERNQHEMHSFMLVRHGKVVGRILMDHPELNFVAAQEDAQSQTGAGTPWMQVIQDLFPFKINSAGIINGAIHFRAFETDPPVDVFLSHVDGSIDNLTNIYDETTPLVSTIGALVGVASVYVTRAVYWIEDAFEHLPIHWMWWPALGGLAVGGISVAMPGEEDCGDGWAVAHADGRTLILVADGLGHGSGAAEAARRALDVFRATVAESSEIIAYRRKLSEPALPSSS